MVLRTYVTKAGRQLRLGQSTGACAALAAKAATRMLFTGRPEAAVSLVTPAGITARANVEDAHLENGTAVCAVRKDAGDDPDVTHGILVSAAVTRTGGDGIAVDGGSGVGRVTRNGLDQPVGAAAINTVPRRMIAEAVRAACGEFGYSGGLRVVISVPGGEALAAKTFNPRLGIVGGLSILGTQGIVEPMSEKAVIDTIDLELRMTRENGQRRLLLTPGKYGETFSAHHPALSRLPRVLCSNHVGEALDTARALAFSGIVVVGHIGKMIKLAGGVMNTHSRVADCRTDILALHAGLAGSGPDLMRAVLDAPTADAGLELLAADNLAAPALRSILQRIDTHLAARLGGTVPAGAVVFSHHTAPAGVFSIAAEALARQWNSEQ